METMYDRIKKLRNSLGWSQEELAKKVGYADKTSIAKIEAGKVDLPQSKIVAFSRALSTTTSYLMDGETESQPTTIDVYKRQVHCYTPVLLFFYVCKSKRQNKRSGYRICYFTVI